MTHHRVIFFFLFQNGLQKCSEALVSQRKSPRSSTSFVTAKRSTIRAQRPLAMRAVTLLSFCGKLIDLNVPRRAALLLRTLHMNSRV